MYQLRTAAVSLMCYSCVTHVPLCCSCVTHVPCIMFALQEQALASPPVHASTPLLGVSLSWLLVEFGPSLAPGLTGEQVVQQHVLPATQAQRCAYTQLLPATATGPPEHYVSFCPTRPFASMLQLLLRQLESLHPGPPEQRLQLCVYVDVLCACQHGRGWEHGASGQRAGTPAAPPEDTALLDALLRAIPGPTLLVMDEGLHALADLRALLEVWRTLAVRGPQGLALACHDPDPDTLPRRFACLDVRLADCTPGADRWPLLLALLLPEEHGGAAAVNARVQASVLFSGDFVKFKLTLGQLDVPEFHRKLREISVRPGEFLWVFLVFWGGLQIIYLISLSIKTGDESPLTETLVQAGLVDSARAGFELLDARRQQPQQAASLAAEERARCRALQLAARLAVLSGRLQPARALLQQALDALAQQQAQGGGGGGAAAAAASPGGDETEGGSPEGAGVPESIARLSYNLAQVCYFVLFRGQTLYRYVMSLCIPAGLQLRPEVCPSGPGLGLSSVQVQGECLLLFYYYISLYIHACLHAILFAPLGPWLSDKDPDLNPDPSNPSTLSLFPQVVFELGDLELALELVHQAKRVSSQAHGEQAEEVAMTQALEARILAAQGSFPEAQVRCATFFCGIR